MQAIHDFWVFNRESIELSIVIALVTGPIWAAGHELTKKWMRKHFGE